MTGWGTTGPGEGGAPRGHHANIVANPTQTLLEHLCLEEKLLETHLTPYESFPNLSCENLSCKGGEANPLLYGIRSLWTASFLHLPGSWPGAGSTGNLGFLQGLELVNSHARFRSFTTQMRRRPLKAANGERLRVIVAVLSLLLLTSTNPATRTPSGGPLQLGGRRAGRKRT